ncbi:MAG: SDR family oxidoreductase [Vicinamibacterales bacterium]
MILVVGATGSLGRKITAELLARGENVRALVRPGKSAALPDGASVARGDLVDRDSLERACNGVRAVVTTASVSKTGTDTIENVDLVGNQHLIAAAEHAGVEHFVFTSTLSASEQSPVPLFKVKAAVEGMLRASRMAHTILQPNAFMDVWFPMLIEGAAASGGPVTLVGQSNRRHAFIAEQDIAAFAAAALSTPAARNSTIVLGGPDAVTLRDVVGAYERAAGRSIPIRSVAPGEPIPGVPEPVWSLAAALETFDSPVPMDETSGTYGVQLTSVADFARSRVAATTR